MVDLKSDIQIIKSYFNNLRDVLYHLIVDNDITEGFLNYDTQLSKYQLKDGKTKKANLLKDLDLIDCMISGNIASSRLFGCELDGCQIEDSSFVIHNETKNSKITNCDLNPNNDFTDCYIDARDRDINCKIDGGIIRSGYIGNEAEVSDETEVVSDLMDAKGKKDKMTGRELFIDRNDTDEKDVKNGFIDLNDKKASFNIIKPITNRNTY